MTPKPLANIVQRPQGAWVARVWLALAGVVAGTGAAVVLIGWQLNTQAEARMDHFGTTMADMAAELGLPHVVQQKQLELENLAKRVVEFDGVQSCSFYTVDGRTLAFAGSDTATPQAKHYPASVTIGDSLAGFARVVLDANRFRPEAMALFASAWPIWFGALAAVLAFALHTAWRTRPKAAADVKPAAGGPSKAAADPAPDLAGEPKPVPSAPNSPAASSGEYQPAVQPMQPKPPSATPSAPAPTPPDAQRQKTAPHDRPDLVLVANLFNAASLSAEAKAHALDQVLHLAGSLAKTHQAAVEPVSGAGVLLRFQPGRGLAAAMAGLELARRIESAELEDARFRCALHGHGATDGDAALADALLLAALAPPRALAVSDAALRCVGQPERLRTTAIPKRNVAALAATTLGRCHVMHGLRA